MPGFCPNCGSMVRDGASFCAKCGTKLSESNPVIAPESTPEAAPVVAAPVVEPVVEAAPAIAPAPVAEAVPAAPAVEPAPVAEPAPAEPVVPAAVAPVTEPAAEVVPAAAPAPVAEAVPAVSVAEPAPVAEPVVPAAVAPVAEPVAEAVPAAAHAPAAEPAPAAAPAPAPAPFAEPAAQAFPVNQPAPAAAPMAFPGAAPSVAPAIPGAAPVPVPFEAPSGPMPDPAKAVPEAPKKKGKGALIGILAACGVVLITLIGVGAFILYNNVFGGNVLERIERKDKVDSGKKYTIYDEDFNDYIIEARWWDYDDTMSKPGVYTTDTETLAFSIEVNEDAEEEIYYAYFYSKDKEFDSSELSKPICEEVIAPTLYMSDDRIFYDVECSKSLKKGYYVVIIASDEKFSKPYIVAYAEIK